MAWTYDATKFNDTTASATYSGATIGQRYQVRFWIQDTVSTRPVFADEEIDWTITQEANPLMAAAALCDSLSIGAGKGIKRKKVGNLEIQYDPMFYRELAGRLRGRGAGHQIPYAGGISIADKIAVEQDTDRVTPKFNVGQGDNPAAPKPSVSSDDPLTSI